MAVNSLKAPNAYLSYTGRDKKLTTFMLWVTEYSQEHKLSGNSHQSWSSTRYYPKSYAPGSVQVKGHVRNSTQQQQLGEFIRSHQTLMLNRPGYANLATDTITLMNLGIPLDGFYVSGFIPNFTITRERFKEHGPEFTFEFEAVRDRYSTNSGIVPARAFKAWFTGAVIDGRNELPFTDEKESYEDSYVDETNVRDDGTVTDSRGIVKSPVPTAIPGAGGRLMPPRE